MLERRPHAVWMGASFSLLTLAGFSVVVAFVLFPDPLPLFDRQWSALERHLGQEEVQAQLTHRFHRHGPKEPCLRYPLLLSHERQEFELAHQLITAGHAPMAEQLHQLVLGWEAEHEGRHHLRDHHQERLLVLDGHLQGLERFILRINHQRVLRGLRGRAVAASVKQRSIQKVSKHLSVAARERFFALWKRHKYTLGAALQKSREITEGDTLSGERMYRVVSVLKHWLAVHGAAPRSLEAFPSELQDDGFGSPFLYGRTPQGVWLISSGSDGLQHTFDDRVWVLHR
ncbi:MAG: hypothetical protein JRH20_16230 [Deltaproteobacteria bacterium]|nr:hypothetical protein [Deltaproteobacteria bacterium]